uniref:VWFC domain-containing protein n=1 Tax=Kryptolebias marmoratus TaxID=37003 RepID=A0A3Q3B481_KRYMA
PSDCVYEQRPYRHTERFYHPADSCRTCSCNNGSVHCQHKPCPFAPCSHPTTQECCRTCKGAASDILAPQPRDKNSCLHEGRERANGETWDDPSDPLCVCVCVSMQNGGVVCVRTSCPHLTCRHPETPPGECCPVCTGKCFHQGEEHPSGSTFTLRSDRCSSCSCLVSRTSLIFNRGVGSSSNSNFLFFFFSSSDQNEVVNCQRRPCPVQCSHPVPSDNCCPVCDSCLYEGVVHSHAHIFTSLFSPCQRCTCVRGTVSCGPLVCPPTPCARPVTKPGQCCPECTGASQTVFSNKLVSLSCSSLLSLCLGPQGVCWMDRSSVTGRLGPQAQTTAPPAPARFDFLTFCL